MGVTLNIVISTPLTPEDHELLSGVAMMTLAVAQFQTDGEKSEEEAAPAPCGDVEYAMEPSGPVATGRICVSNVGHKGRHRYREAPAPVAGMN